MFCHCIYIYNSWRAGHIIPVPLKPVALGAHAPVGRMDDGCASKFMLGYETWIKSPSILDDECPMDITEWRLVVKEAKAYMLFYYMSKVQKHNDWGFRPDYMDIVGDILFTKKININLVDADDEDVVEVLKNLEEII